MQIKDVVEEVGISADTLRYYEKLGLCKPHRKENGIRDYTESDLRRVNFIKCMRQAGVSLEFLKKYIDLFEQGDDTFDERKKILQEQKIILEARMSEIKTTLDYLNYKLDNYETLGKKKY